MMPDVLVCGGGMRAFGRGRDGSVPRDWLIDVTAGALKDAAIGPRDVDAVVLGCESDHLSLQLSPGAAMLDEIGLVPCPVLRVESGGASGGAAVRVGIAQLMSGMARCVLVLGFEHAASHLSGADVGLLYGLSFDMDREAMGGATAPMLYALSIVAHMARHGTTVEDLAAVAVKNRGNAVFNPLAHRRQAVSVAQVLASDPVAPPYKRYDCSPLSDGAAALVLMRAGRAPRRDRPVVRIAGSGAASDWLRLGDRPDPGRFAGKQRAARAAYAMAGVTDPARDIGLAEVYDAFSGTELQALEALGLAREGNAAAQIAYGRHDRDGALPVNLSGGLIGQGGVPGATGIAQVLTVTRLLEGRYWPGLQPADVKPLGLAECHGGLATANVVHILERMD